MPAKRTKIVTVAVHGMEGSGPTKAEARADAIRRIESAMKGYYSPTILSAGGETVVIHRDPTGWNYSFLRNDTLSEGHWCTDGAECERAARRHLGDLATDWRTCTGPADVHPIVRDEADRRDIANGCRWQRQYHAAIGAGLRDNDARNWIGGFPTAAPIPDSLGLPAAVA